MRKTGTLARGYLTRCAAVALVAGSIGQAAAQPAEQSYTLEAQDLSVALTEVARISGAEIVAPADILVGLTTRRLLGIMTAAEAVDRLLAGTGLRAERLDGAFIIKRDDDRGGRIAEDDALITVTGTRIRGVGPVGSPVITIDRTDIERSGYATTHQVLQSIPQNFGGGPNEGSVGYTTRNNIGTNSGYGSSINLRGLGSGSTLVLVNGNRPALGGLYGAFADLSLVPSSAVERIEILGDGASALYGSDAVGGVVNILLRRDFDGGESRGRFGVADGFDDVQASQLLGESWTSGHVAIAYEYYRRGRLSADDRDFATEDLRPFGGPDYRKDFSNPGTILAGGRRFAIPTGQDGTGLTADDLLPDQANLSDGRSGTDLLPELARHSLYGSIEQDLTHSVRLSAEGFFADRRSSTFFLADNFGNVVVPTSNPFYVDPIGTNRPIVVNYDFTRDLGVQTLSNRVRAYSAVVGLDATIGRWFGELRGSYGLQKEDLRIDNIPNYFRLARALADPDPATAYYLFGDGSFTNPATIEEVRGFVTSEGRYRVWSASAKIDGPLIPLPAGEIKLAAGAEYRRERYGYELINDGFGPNPIEVPISGLPIDRDILAGYAELLVPIFGSDARVPGFERLDLSLAGRIERYDAFGTTANPKFGVRWQPTDGLTVRGSYGTSFRAPGFQEIRQGPGTRAFFSQPLADSGTPDGTSNALILFGNAPDLDPETAQTWTVGFDLKPTALPGLRASATYFDISYRDRIANLSPDYRTFLQKRDVYAAVINDMPDPAVIAAFYGDPSFTNPFGIAAEDVEVLIDAQTQNLASVEQSGLDFNITYQALLGGAQVDVGLAGAYLFEVRQKIAPSAPAADVAGTIGHPVELRLRGNFGATLGRYGLSAFVNYLDGYRNTAVVPEERVDSWTTVDIQVGYSVPRGEGALGGFRLALSVSNLFDRDPPYVNHPNGFSASGFDPENASSVGRLVALQLSKSW